MKLPMSILGMIIVLSFYFIATLLIAIVAIVVYLFTREDITSTKKIVSFIEPLRSLEKFYNDSFTRKDK